MYNNAKMLQKSSVLPHNFYTYLTTGQKQRVCVSIAVFKPHVG